MTINDVNGISAGIYPAKRALWGRGASIGACCLVLAACGGSGGGASSFTVNATAGSGGNVTPSIETVNDGSTASFTVTPNAGYKVAGVSGCGGSLSGNTYTTGAVTADCTVTASFSFGLRFTWVSGSNIVDASGVYGVQGTPAAGNIPGARTSAVSWIDASGDLWLFGGNGYDSAGATSGLNDLWKYSPSGGEWTWVGGSNTVNANGVYGTRGTPAAGNVPGARNTAVGWTDSGGSLWLFGGRGKDSTGSYSDLNDLWEYSPTSGKWSWVSGSNTVDASGVYGTRGTPGGVPGARHDAVGWADASGNLWLFGGDGLDSTGTGGDLNDLWEYSPTSGKWTWVGGSDTINASGVYGTQGSPATTNVLGARYGAVSWIDTSGNFWLFGGNGYDSSGTAGDLNDLWEYVPASGKWIWVSGSSTVNASGVYGTQGTSTATNVPGARLDAVSWTDAGGNLWLFGGYGYDAAGNPGELNDLWEFSPSNGEWSWMGGSNTIFAGGVYGSRGTSAATTVPGARYIAASGADSSGNFWLFGGLGYDSAGNRGYLNDLWSFHP